MQSRRGTGTGTDGENRAEAESFRRVDTYFMYESMYYLLDTEIHLYDVQMYGACIRDWGTQGVVQCIQFPNEGNERGVWGMYYSEFLFCFELGKKNTFPSPSTFAERERGREGEGEGGPNRRCVLDKKEKNQASEQGDRGMGTDMGMDMAVR